MTSRYRARRDHPDEKTRHHRRPRFLASVAGVVAVALGAGALAVAAPAGAATVGWLTTTFEIDGDKPTDSGVDWDDVLDGSPTTGPYATALGYQSTGILGASFSYDAGAAADGCSVGADDTVFSGGAKIDDPVWDVSGSPEPNPKSDACSGAAAYEVIDVGGTAHVVLYQYWTRFQGLGDVTTYQLLEGGDSTTRSDDFLVEFDYQSAGGETLVDVLAWDGDTWVTSGATLDYETAVGANVDTPATGRDATFGELAIDLTTAGLFEPGTCDTFTVSGFVTRTGNSAEASTEDVLLYDDPLTLTNCGALTVEKRSNPAGITTDDIFEYVLDGRSGNGHGNRTTAEAAVRSIVSTIGVGDLHTWNAVRAGEYSLTETIDDEGWLHESTVCTVTNPATGEVETYSGESLRVYVGATTACVLTNTLQEASVSITKTVTDAPAGQEWSFDVSIDPVPSGQEAVQQVTSSSPRVGWEHLAVGTEYTIAETPADEWVGGELACTGLADADAEAPGFQFVATAALVLDCALTNTADPAGSLIEKTVVSAEKSDGDSWVVTYAVVATNLSNVFPLVYDLADTPRFGEGIVIDRAVASGPEGSLAASWTPGGLLADDLALPAGESHEYTVTVEATVPRSVFSSGAHACPEGEAGEAGGFLNTAALTVDAVTTEASACEEPEPPVEEPPVVSPERPETPALAATGLGGTAIGAALLLLLAGGVVTVIARRRASRSASA